jgi:hypothetical protein
MHIIRSAKLAIIRHKNGHRFHSLILIVPMYWPVIHLVDLGHSQNFAGSVEALIL